MKKQKFTGKLSLNKETISRLQAGQMSRVVGGSDKLCGSITGAHACCPQPSGDPICPEPSCDSCPNDCGTSAHCN